MRKVHARILAAIFDKQTRGKPYSGRILVRVDPDLHRRLATGARGARMSMNAYIAERLRENAS